MKNFLANMKNKFSNISSRTKKEFAALATVASAMPMAVYADKADTLVNEIVSIICKIFRYIGILLLAWSIGMIVLAFKNEDADSKSRGMMLAFVSCVLIAIEPIITAIVGKA